jgi:hypothetical protein
VGSRRRLSRVLDLWHQHFCFNSPKENAVVLGRGRYGDSKERKRSGRATSCHASVRGGAKARTPFLRVRTQDHYAGWLALGKTHSGTDTNSVGLVREED